MGKKPDLSNLTKKERKEYLKEFRQQQERKSSAKSLGLKLLIAAIAAVVVGGIGYLIATSDPQASLKGEEIAEQGREHIDPGSSHPQYNSNPPTSGPHWPTPQTCDFYTDEVADEAVIHSMEHGAIWISYKDKNDAGLVDQMRSLFDKESNKVLISPRPANDSKIAVASWTRLLKLDEFDEDQIIDFIRSNKNNSPEPLATCEGITHNAPTE